MTWGSPWPVIGTALAQLFTIVIAIELVIALVKGALSADDGQGSEL
jgi:hypothetical protein